MPMPVRSQPWLRAFNSFGRATRLGVVAAAATLLGGCFDLGYSVVMKKDGTSGADISLKFDREMEDVFGFIESIAELRPEGALFLRQGICPALELAAAFAPQMPFAVKAKQGVVNNRFACDFNLDGPLQTEQLIQILKAAPIGQMGIIDLKGEGPKRYRLTINLAGIPDNLPQLIDGMVQGMNKQGRPSPEAVQRLTKAIVPGSVAFTKMGLRDGSIELAVAAPRIVETNGKNENGAARFSWKWTEFVLLLMSAEARRGKSYYVVFEQ